MTLPLISVGGKGVISVTSNVAPKLMSDMTSAALKGDFVSAQKIHTLLFPLMRTLMKVETNPSPVKTAMNILGMDMGELRLPLVEPKEDGKALLRSIMSDIGLM